MLGTANKLKNARNIALRGAVSGNANFDGSGNVNIVTTQANISILTGHVTGTAQPGGDYLSGQAVINFPNGFNKDNCVVLAIGLDRSDAEASVMSYGVESTFRRSAVYIRGSFGRSVTFRNTNDMMLNLYFDMGGTSQEGFSVDYTYKIVLMKIS